MSATVKQLLFTDWHLIRWLRLALGTFILIQAIQRQDALSGAIAMFLLFQAITNTGCCGSGSCAVPRNKKTADQVAEVQFEEVK